MGLSKSQIEALSETMDLEIDDIYDLFERAQVEWEAMKE